MMLGFPLLSLSVGAQPAPEALQFDPYLPGELNEQALMSLVDEDLQAARIYMERAYRLNPLSPDINGNLEVIRNLANGQSKYQISQKQQTIKSSSKTQVSDSSDLIPPLWPRK